MAKTSRLVIVARTRMYGGRVCIGALTEEAASIRLMNSSCSSDTADKCPFMVGEQWEVTYSPCGNRKPPHVEDVAVEAAQKLGVSDDLIGFILARSTPWQGPIEGLFDGLIRFTGNGGGYISAASGIPPLATAFWLPSTVLKLSTDDRGKQGYYSPYSQHHLSYVGLAPAIPQINVGQLVRVSLAGWWRPSNSDPTFEERCYGQLSGWY